MYTLPSGRQRLIVSTRMEAPRPSVDIPHLKTLVALKRVRSLRDPSTNSMSKFAAVIENLNLVANSSSVAHLDTSKHKHHATQKGNCLLKEENEDILSNSGSNFSSKKPFPRSTMAEKPCGAKVRGSKPTRTKLVHRSRGNRARKALDSTRGRHFRRHDEEEVDSYREPELDLADRVTATGKKSLYSNFKKPSPVVSHTGSPCMSASEAHTTGSRRHTMGITTLDSQSKSNDVVGSNFSGCGISYCWSGTPKYRGRDIYSDDEEQEKPLLSVEQTEIACINAASYPQSPRSLSKKFRPKSFDELVGLNIVSQSLLHAVTKGKIAPVYLFHGPQGNGKTSAARIFAAALNCLSDSECRPCGFCRECVLLFSGRSRNVRELDAAKINHKERLRSLLQSASVVPCTARFEVFIIDECQSLREEAWAAIFKSLDEQPGHAVYVMITSDLDALPRNCISRCQRYHFPKIKEVDTVCRLEKISIEEELQIDMDALKLIAAKSNGSVRDAETMLDQLVLLGKRITVPLVNELIGVVSDDELLNLLDLALSSDTANTVRRSRELMMSRIDPLQLVSQLANVIMDILAGRSAFSEIGRSFIQRHAASDIGMQKLRHALKVLSETEKQLRSSKNQATWLTVALLQLNMVESSPLTEINSSHACSEVAYLRDDGILITGKAWEAKGTVCYACDQNKPGCKDRNCYRKKMESLWTQVTQRCQPHSFKSFLQQEGCLSAVYVHEGVTVAEIEFYHPDHVSRAVKSQQLIACALQHVLGSNLEIRIKFEPKSIRKVTKPKKPSFSLLSCSGRKKERSLSTISDDCETDASARIESSFNIYSSHQAQNSSPFISQFGDKQLPDDHDMKAMIIRKAEDNGGAELIAADGQGHLQKDGKVIADCSGKLSEIGEYIKIAEPKTRPTCFPRRLRFQTNFFSSSTAPTICLTVQQQNKPELSIPDKESSETYFCMYDPYALNSCSASQFTCSSREDNLPCKDSRFRSKLFCWRMTKPQVID